VTVTAAPELEGMPEPRRLRRIVVDGTCVIEHGRQVLFCYDETDIGMRNLAVVALTQAKVAVKDAAVLFGLTPEYVSELRGRARKEGSAGLVKVMGRPPKLTPRQVQRVRELAGQGVSKAELARRFGVTRPVILDVVTRRGVVTVQPPLPGQDEATVLPDLGETTGRGGATEAMEPVAPQPVSQPVSQPQPVSGGSGPVVEPGAARIGTGSVVCRYAGAMLAHAFFARVGAGQVFGSLQAARATVTDAGNGPVVFDDVALVCAATLAFGLGASSIEGVKHLDRAGAGALAGLVALPELRTLRPRLAAIADRCDPLAVHSELVRAMLAADAPAVGVYFVDDHFVPYSGAQPVGKGWNTKRKAAMPCRADTLVTDYRGRAVAFVTGGPSGLTKTLPPALAQLRAITGPDAKIMLGFDRGGAYASVFTACRDADVDWVTYRRGGLAATTAVPIGHTYVDPDAVATRVVLADEIIEFTDYGPCRQLTLFEDDRPVLLWHPARAKAGVPEAHDNGMHALRHFFASVVLDGGASIRAVAEWLGHEDPGFTLRVYAHLLPKRRRQAASGRRQRAPGSAAVTAARSHVAQMWPGNIEFPFRRWSDGVCPRCRSTARTRAGAGAAGWGRPRGCA
jgi:transposase